MDDTRIKLLDLITTGKIRAISFDLEIANDSLKYSAWCTALATAGIGLALTNWEKLDPFKPSGFWSGAGLLATTIPLFASAMVGAYLNWQLNKDFSRKRQEMTLILKQQIIVIADDNASETGREMGNKILGYGYLKGSDQDQLKELERLGKKQIDTDTLLIWQQGSAGLGYIVAITLASLKWLGIS